MNQSVQVPLGTLKQIKNGLKEVNLKLAEQLTLQKKYLDVDEASVYLKISTSTIYKLTASEILRFHKPRGKKIYFKRKWLDKYIESSVSVGKIRLNKEDDLAKDWVDKNFQTRKSC